MRDITLGDTFDIKFTTRAFATGVPTTLAGTPVISAYPDNSVTQLTAGITLSADFDAVAGLNNVRVVATVVNGYAAGSTYALVITTGTVGGTSVVGEVVGEFTVQASAAFTRLGAPAGASVSADVAAVKVDTAAILVDTGTTLDARIPAALVGGRIDASVGAIAAGVGSGIRKNVALAKFEFLMTDSTNHAPATGKTVTVTRSIDNAAFAAGTLSAVTEIAFGVYSVDFGAGDLNGTAITLRATATGCDDLLVTIVPDP